MSASKTTTTCFFLEKLPAEIRNSIYELVLVSEAPIKVNANLKKFLAILNTCTQIRKEATGFASQNEFQVACGVLPPIRLQAWLKTLSKTHPLVKRLRVVFFCSDDAGKDRQRLTPNHRDYKHPPPLFPEQIRWVEITLEGRNFAEVIRKAVKDGYLAQATLILEPWWEGGGKMFCLKKDFAAVSFNPAQVEYLPRPPIFVFPPNRRVEPHLSDFL